MSNDEIVLWLLSSARRLCGGSTMVVVGVTEVEVEQRTEVIEQEEEEGDEDVRKVNF